ncbi:TIGR00730 family Rossman fold protein [Paracnuella aquatica]|uniref:LOG family protein n=1 Tax=Paracnuella aquatica TaxID=2268757 RepID=UPI000DEF5739|nr:TIGR00730 family Rossman fold protein [Paracnuella aquatica]RPD48847.1 TIGR00730 family Rossman fold protein [Paracnuella aquatica]
MGIQSMAVFCASKYGNNPLFTTHTTEMGRLMAEKGITMIYGGGKNGLMGCVADACMAAGGTVRGIIPTRLIEWETQHTGISELTVVENMHQRKRLMYELCDAAIILPGGFGTLDELFEMLTWNGLALHDKKVFLLNSGGFYNHLLQHLQLLQDEGLLYGKIEEALTVLNEPEDLLQHL